MKGVKATYNATHICNGNMKPMQTNAINPKCNLHMQPITIATNQCQQTRVFNQCRAVQ